MNEVLFDYESSLPKLISGNIIPWSNEIIFEDSNGKKKTKLPLKFTWMLPLLNGENSLKKIISFGISKHDNLNFNQILLCIKELNNKNFFTERYDFSKYTFIKQIDEGFLKTYFIEIFSFRVLNLTLKLPQKLLKYNFYFFNFLSFLGLILSPILISSLTKLNSKELGYHWWELYLFLWVINSFFRLTLNFVKYISDDVYSGIILKIDLFGLFFELTPSDNINYEMQKFRKLHYVFLFSFLTVTLMFLIGDLKYREHFVQLTVFFILWENSNFLNYMKMKIPIQNAFGPSMHMGFLKIIYKYNSILKIIFNILLIAYFNYLIQFYFHMIEFTKDKEFTSGLCYFIIIILNSVIIINLIGLNKTKKYFKSFFSTKNDSLEYINNFKISDNGIDEFQIIWSELIQDIEPFCLLKSQNQSNLFKVSDKLDIKKDTHFNFDFNLFHIVIILLEGEIQIIDDNTTIRSIFAPYVIGESQMIESHSDQVNIKFQSDSKVILIPIKELKDYIGQESSNYIKNYYNRLKVKNCISKLQSISNPISINLFLKYSKILEYKSGSVIYTEGATLDYIGLVVEGCLIHKFENQQSFFKIHRSQFFGEVSLQNDIVTSETLIAFEDTVVVIINKNDFLEILKSDLNFSLNFELELLDKIKFYNSINRFSEMFDR